MNESPETSKKTPVFQLFDLFDSNAGKSPRSKAAHVKGLHALLTAILVGGLRWTKDDAKNIARHFGWTRGQYRFRIDEAAYADAVTAGNLSACASIERYLERSQWRWPLNSQSPDGYAHGFDCVIGLGFHVWYEGVDRLTKPSEAGPSYLRGWWKVTSIHEDRLTICKYDEMRVEHLETGGTNIGTRIVARRTLTREEVAALSLTEEADASAESAA